MVLVAQQNDNPLSIKYFKVHALKGHLGAGKSAEIIFYIKAPHIANAIKIAKSMPTVKHSKFIISAKEISDTEYLEGRKTSAYVR